MLDSIRIEKKRLEFFAQKVAAVAGVILEAEGCRVLEVCEESCTLVLVFLYFL